jgi:hypothetical protein
MALKPEETIGSLKEQLVEDSKISNKDMRIFFNGMEIRSNYKTLKQ